jgi:O-antigen/teichoic acid export membrane protein
MAPLNGPQDHQDADGIEIGKSVESILSFHESLSSQNTEKHKIFIDDLPAQIDLKTVRKSSPSYFGIDGVPLDEQETWAIPATRGSSKELKPASRRLEEDYISLILNLLKSSGIYALASIASPLVSLILAPFLTHHLARSDYGALALLNTVISLVAGITQFGLGSAFFRAYSCDYESKRDRSAVLSTLTIILSLTSIPVAIIMITTAPWLTSLVFNSPNFSDPVRIAGLVILLQNLTVPGLAWLRAESRAALYAGLAIVILLVNLGATIVLVGVLHMGIAGSLIAIAMGYGVALICTLPAILLRAGLSFRLDISWNLLSFGLPLVLNYVSLWFLQLSDRYLLTRLGSLDQTASYAVAYSLGGVLSTLIITPFILAWPAVMFSVAKREDAARVFQLIFRWYSIVLLFAAYGLAFFCTIALDILFPPTYHSAAPIIPIIAMSIMFFGIYNIILPGVGILRKTWIAALLMTVAALVNIASNIVLIPHYGSMGAAVSTLIAYGMLALAGYIVNQRIYPIPFEIGLFLVALLLGIALYVGSNVAAQNQKMYGAWAISIGALVLYGVCLVLLGKLAARRHKLKN